MSTVAGSPPFRRARLYTSWEDVAQLEERTAQAFRRVPQPSYQPLTVPAVVAAGDATVYAVVTGAGALTVSARRPGQTLTVRSLTGTVVVRDDAGATIDGAASLSVASGSTARLLWTGSTWVTV